MVDHGVAVWAYGNEVGDWINVTLASQGCHRHEVMDMNEVLAQCPVNSLEVEAAYHTVEPVMSDACGSSFGTTLNRVHDYLLSGTFWIPLWGVEFFGKSGVDFLLRRIGGVPIVAELKQATSGKNRVEIFDLGGPITRIILALAAPFHREGSERVALLRDQSDVLAGLRVPRVFSASVLGLPFTGQDQTVSPSGMDIPRAEYDKPLGMVHE